ncbi:MAG: hypothetical protein K6A67_06555 [Bacteroidales bacterium]|nr:hypothetical protein [Bacteroidales bacterium]
MNQKVNNVSERQPLSLPDPQGNGLRGMPASTFENKKYCSESPCGANTTLSVVSRPQGATPSNAQCGEQCGDPLQELMTAWQQHSDRIEQIAGQHDLSHIKLAPRLLVLSSRRRRILSSLAMALVCLASIVGMVILRQHYISDIFEQLFFAFLALLMVVTLIQCLRQIFLLRRQPFTFHLSPITFHLSPYSRAAVFASIVVMFLFLAVPVQNGRAMSHGSPSHRNAALTSVSFVLSHIQ